MTRAGKVLAAALGSALLACGSDPALCGDHGCPNPHPPGWTARAAHGAAARADTACVGCHRQGAAVICIVCHRAGAIGGDPHPSPYSTAERFTKTPIGGGIELACATCHPQ